MEFIFTGLLYFVVPLTGLKFYLFVCQRMKEREIASPPVVPLFLLFATYAGWLVVLLTSLFWFWSGMAAPGFAYLVLLAPVLMLIQASPLFRQRKFSCYHYSTFVGSSAYFVLPGLIWLIWLGRQILKS
jgi:hypothetical protein